MVFNMINTNDIIKKLEETHIKINIDLDKLNAILENKKNSSLTPQEKIIQLFIQGEKMGYHLKKEIDFNESEFFTALALMHFKLKESIIILNTLECENSA